MPDTKCSNCGATVSRTPEDDGLHPVQTRTDDEDGEAYCEACFFDEYDHTGDQIARADKVEMGDDELADLLAESMQANELRRWMSGHGLSRSRGARKAKSAEQAVEQDRVLIAAALDEMHDLTDGSGDYNAMCSCGYEEWFGSPEAAEEAAEEHDESNPDCRPKAWAPDGVRLYG